MKNLSLFEDFNTIDHLKQRGVDPNKTKVVIDEESGDSFFFLYNLSGQIVGYQKYNNRYPKKGQRTSSNPRLVKYYNYVSDEDMSKMIAVWGLETYKITDKYMFITEGIFDIIRAHESGYSGIAVLCNDPNQQLVNWLETLPQIKIVIYDNDKAGQELKKLGDYSYSVENGKDLNDLTPDEAKQFLDNIINTIENRTNEHFDTISANYKNQQSDLVKFRDINDNIRDHSIEPTKSQLKVLDEISGYTDFYATTKKWTEHQFNVFKKYDFEDIEDRLLEFFDEISNFQPRVMFALSKRNSSLGIRYDKLNDKRYFISELGYVIGDICYNCSSNKISIDEYYKIVKPSIYISFNISDRLGRTQYPLTFLESLADRIVNRFKYLYDIQGVEFTLEREGRKYDINADVDDYSFIMYLKD